MAGAQPRTLLGQPPRTIAPGQPAELVLFDGAPGSGFASRATLIGLVAHKAP
jgi:hypothetical protein